MTSSYLKNQFCTHLIKCAQLPVSTTNDTVTATIANLMRLLFPEIIFGKSRMTLEKSTEPIFKFERHIIYLEGKDDLNMYLQNVLETSAKCLPKYDVLYELENISINNFHLTIKFF